MHRRLAMLRGMPRPSGDMRSAGAGSAVARAALAGVLVVLAAAAGPAHAADGVKPAAGKPASSDAALSARELKQAAEPAPAASPAVATPEVKEFCANIADKAADARFAWEAKTLADMRREVEARTAALDAKRAEVEGWVARRQALLDAARDGIVAIYAKMRAETAAEQLSAMEEPLAAALLAKLDPRAASKILNEMSPKKAVTLTAMLGGDDAGPASDPAAAVASPAAPGQGDSRS